LEEKESSKSDQEWAALQQVEYKIAKILLESQPENTRTDSTPMIDQELQTTMIRTNEVHQRVL